MLKPISVLSTLEENIRKDFPGVENIVLFTDQQLREGEGMPEGTAESIDEVKNHMIERLRSWIKFAHYGEDGTKKDYPSWFFVVQGREDNDGWQSFVTVYFL